MIHTNKQQFSTDEKKTIISLLLIGLFIVLVAYMNNSESKPTKENNFKTEIK